MQQSMSETHQMFAEFKADNSLRPHATPASQEAGTSASDEANTPASEEAQQMTSEEANTPASEEAKTHVPLRNSEDDALSIFGGNDFDLPIEEDNDRFLESIDESL